MFTLILLITVLAILANRQTEPRFGYSVATGALITALLIIPSILMLVLETS